MKLTLSFNKKGHEVKTQATGRFNEWSKKYDRSILQHLVFRNSHDMFIRHINSEKRPLKILDVGCGTGEFAMKLKGGRQDIQMFGIDISPEMIGIARKKSKSQSGFDFRVGDVENLPYENNTFDYITCAHSFHHYPNKSKAVRQMFRVLKDDGHIMIIDGYKDKLLGRFIFDFIIKRHEGNVHHLHSKQFHRILNKVGFKNIRQTVFNPFIPLLLTRGRAHKKDERQQ
ncbi:MAG: methyltransferase domain-containing protein [Candidatus Omnitrophica bacterium]|nr:methyltransferase domain-containing protein [Candidatus Omnitrophota bacterium]